MPLTSLGTLVSYNSQTIEETLPLLRFYSLRTFVLPLLTAVFMLMHFPMIRKQGISGPL
ncbi:hypothetical protein BRADI_4g16212v3 [Brachypodium distachyon]|uniref:Cytochrome b/b6 N-terminal region profile domain-containing protein n=1 Tax=Brachypodium distachyon TaxID=15368 RepID=A0A2K2CN51_BRADI|nr:hypothetical protein BRADI_4g16212v3 [Brachypodium distachyon]